MHVIKCSFLNHNYKNVLNNAEAAYIISDCAVKILRQNDAAKKNEIKTKRLISCLNLTSSTNYYH